MFSTILGKVHDGQAGAEMKAWPHCTPGAGDNGRMKIAHLILTRRFAGSERYAVELANVQAIAGHEVHFILCRSAAENRPDAIAHRLDAKVRITRVPDLFRRWHARRAIARIAPEVSHAHLSGACRALHGASNAGLRVGTLHIHYKPAQHARLDALIAIAPWQLAAIPLPLREHSAQIDNWTLPSSASESARERIRAAHGISPSAFLFGALGRCEPGKGFDVLIEAWKRAGLPKERARLAIVGQGTAWKVLRHAAPADVLMPGFVTDTRDWLEAFDAFVSPARREPFGLVLLEAMNARLPILASASDGAKHLAAQIGTPLFPIDDADALAARLRELYEAHPPRRDYGMSRFDITARSAEIEAFYRRELKR